MAIKKYTKGKAIKLSENFNSTEFDCKCGAACSSTLIDETLVALLQQIRNHFKKPIIITSGYRCAAHNKEVGGATNSYHSKGQAADIVVYGVSPQEVAKYAESIGVKGIGLYDSFVHIDTRTSKSFWYSSKQEYRATFGGSSSAAATLNKITVSLPTLKKGSNGACVEILQILIGASKDGIFGNGTEAALKAAQKKKGLPQTGIADKATWEAVFNNATN